MNEAEYHMKMKPSAFILNTSFTENCKGGLKNWGFFKCPDTGSVQDTGQHSVYFSLTWEEILVR